MKNRPIHYIRVLGGAALVLGCVIALIDAPRAAQSESGEKVFRAGAVTSNITPPLGLSIAGNMGDWKGERIHDELHVRCLVLDDGTRQLAFAICDSCMIPREIFDEAKRRVSEKTGLPVQNMMMASTHTHSAPAATHVFQSQPDEDYLDFLTHRIVDGVVRALSQLEPARIGWGSADEPDEVFNRRWYMKEGTLPPDPFGNADEKVRMNPPRASEHLLEPAGPTDPEVSVISIQSLEGRPIAVLANYSLHYVGDVGGMVSADYFGLFASKLEQRLEAGYQSPPFVGILTNGTSGDINNIDFRKEAVAKKPYEQMNHVADQVAEAAFKALETLSYRDWVPLSSAEKNLELGVRKPTPEEVEQARAIMAGAKNPYMETAPEIYARETVYLKDYPDTVPVLLQVFAIGDLAIAAIPCEVFVEIGLALKEKTPFADAFTIELANGYNGYLPTPKHHELGGYETWRAKSSYLEEGASPKIEETILELMAALSQRGS